MWFKVFCFWHLIFCDILCSVSSFCAIAISCGSYQAWVCARLCDFGHLGGIWLRFVWIREVLFDFGLICVILCLLLQVFVPGLCWNFVWFRRILCDLVFVWFCGDFLFVWSLKQPLRPILIQLDLQSVEKVPLRTFAWALPRKCWKLVFLASAWLGVFSKIYPELFPASSGAQLQEITVSTSSIQLGYITVPDRIEKNVYFDCNRTWSSWIEQKVLTDGDFLQLGPWRSGKQLSDRIDLGENCDSFWGEEDRFLTFSRQKLVMTCERTERYFFNGLQI